MQVQQREYPTILVDGGRGLVNLYPDLLGDAGDITGISPTEKLVLMALAWLAVYRNDPTPYRTNITVSQSAIAEWTGLARATVLAALRNLEHSWGLISTSQNANEVGGRAAKTYRLIYGTPIEGVE